MSFFKGLAGGLARGVESALTLEDQRIEDQTKEALKEFKSRVKDQKARRQTRQGKLENAIGRITAEGYSLTTAASLVKQNGIAGAEVIMKNGRLAIEAGIPREDYIKEVTQATSPVALSKELSTVSQAAETLAFQAFPAISTSEFSAPKAPFSGSIISPEDDQDPEYRKQMLARLSESGVLPEQAKPEFESLPSGNTFTINRDLVPTAIELEKLRSDALRSTTEKLWYTYANGTDAEKAAAKATLSGMQTIKNNDALAELRNQLLDKTTTKEERTAISQRLQDFTNSNLSSEDKLKKFSDAVISLTSQFKTTVDSQFSRTLITPKLEPLSDKAALLKQKSPGQKEQFVINGERSALVDVGSTEHKELEAKYLMERRKRVVSLLDQQPNIPELYRQRIEANLLPEEVVSEVVDPEAGKETEVNATAMEAAIQENRAAFQKTQEREVKAASNLAATISKFKRDNQDATSDSVVIAANADGAAVTLGQLEAKVASVIVPAEQVESTADVYDKNTRLDADAYIKIVRDAIDAGKGDDIKVKATVKKALLNRLPPRNAAALADMWKLAKYYKPGSGYSLVARRGSSTGKTEEWQIIDDAIKGLTGGEN